MDLAIPKGSEVLSINQIDHTAYCMKCGGSQVVIYSCRGSIKLKIHDLQV